MEVSKIALFGQDLGIKDVTARNAIKRKTGYDFSNIVIIGDSFTAGSGLLNPETENWAAQFCDRVGATTKNIFGYPGIGFITTAESAGGRNLQDAITLSAGSVADRESVTCVVVQGGRNDAVQTYDAAYTASSTFISNCRSAFPNADIIALFDLNYDIVSRNRHNGGAAAFSDRGLMCTYNAYTWLPFREDVLQSDRVHPTAGGAILIANWFLQEIMGGEWGYTKVISRESFSGWVTISNGQLEIVIEGNETRSGPDVTLGDFPSGTYFTNNATFPVWRDNVSPCYLYFINKEMHLQTPAKADVIGSWRARINVAFPMYQ